MKAEVTSVVHHDGIGVHPDTPVHENTNYLVFVDTVESYKVVNKVTGVTEFKDPQIANAISYAEHGNSFIVNELWKWVAVQGSKNKEALDKDSSVIEFTSDMGLEE